jgi:exodeoxyribonuclease V beta subunit
VKALSPADVPLRGTTLIESSAGTGKTYTITTLFVRLLLEARLEVSQILVVTFTRAATAELRDRIRRRLTDAIAIIDDAAAAERDAALAELLAARRAAGELAADRAWLAQAVRDFDEAAICTIHAFCQRTLTEHAFESQSPFDLSLLEAQAPELEEFTHDYWARVAYDASPRLLSALDAHRVAPQSLLELTKKALRDPRMPVLPDAAPPSAQPAEHDPYAKFSAARERAAALWASDAARVTNELNVKGRLHGGSYRAEHVGAWLRELDGLASWEPHPLPAYAAKLRTDTLREATNAKWKDNPPKHAFFDAMAALCEAADGVKAALKQQAVGVRRDLVDYARGRAAERRRELGLHSFDDLLQALRDALEGPAGALLRERLVSRHPAALIDEFQDTDPIQYAIFKALYAGGRARCLFLIGDPKQAIYAFRGADVFAYLEASRDAGDATYTLDVNYRSDPRLVAAVNAVFERARLPFLFPEIRFSPVRHREGARERLSGDAPALQFLFVPAARAGAADGKPIATGWGKDRLPRLVAGEIAALLQSGETLDGERIRARDVAVLCRTNEQARNTRDALAALGVPTVLDGDSSVFQSEVAGELSHVLWAVARPADTRKLGAALSTSILGLRGDALLRVRNDDAAIEIWLEHFARWNQLWHERGFTPMLHALLDEAAVQTQLLSRLDGERRLTDLLHLGELLHQAAMQQHLGPLALLHWFAQVRHDAKAGGAAESAQLRLEHDEHALRLTTMHRSKGLEYPIVFCPFLWTQPTSRASDEVYFHDPADHLRVKLDVGSDDFAGHRRAAQREELAEALRLAYVALTRARHRCYVVWGHFKGASPLGYLLHQGGLAAPDEKAIEERLKSMTDAALRAELDALAAASGGAIGARDLRFEPAARLPPEIEATRALSARACSRVLRAAPRASSFSRLTAEAGQRAAAAEDEADHDAAAASEEATGEAQAAERAAPEAPVVLHAFPQGARPGTLIHGVLEHIDFTRADADELPAQVERFMRIYGEAHDVHGDALVRGVDAVLRTPLGDAEPALTLSRVERAHRVEELEFTLSTAHAAQRLSPARLSDVFRRFAAPAADPGYAGALRGLRALPPSEFLKGFIDLVFRDGERFYVVDYKSNHLGAAAADYAPERLVPAMREHHYFLQYHLYSLALHRYLTLRVPGYDYERCFGGVYYLFVRGMAPEHARGTGVFFDRPALALLEALAGVLGEAEGA